MSFFLSHKPKTKAIKAIKFVIELEKNKFKINYWL